MESNKGLLGEIMARASADPAFREIQRKYAGSGILSWVQEDEQALLFGIGAYADGNGQVVEIGSFQGGSSCFLAAGLKRRGEGRLTCIDPFLGGPTWLGMAPQNRSLEIFRNGIRACGVEDWVDARVGDSGAVAAIWPGEPVAAVFIDGDHSFQGALKDFECWLPKVMAGGLILIDNTIDRGCPGVGELAELVKTLGSVRYLGVVGQCGNAVFQKTEMPAWEALRELSRACAARGVYRSWDMTLLHETKLPPNYLQSRDWTDGTLDEPYQLAFLARCGPGDYGYSTASRPADRAMIRGLSRDRRDGKVFELGGMADRLRGLLYPPAPHFRVILCAPEEATRYAPRLLPGGLMLANVDDNGDPQAIPAGLKTFQDADLQAVGSTGNRMLHGIWRPHLLTSDIIFANAMADVTQGAWADRKAS
jgi:predicted O-methyltransferase YrrM